MISNLKKKKKKKQASFNLIFQFWSNKPSKEENHSCYLIFDETKSRKNWEDNWQEGGGEKKELRNLFILYILDRQGIQGMDGRE